MARVVVVDHDADTRDMLAYTLHLDGHEVELAATGCDGLRLSRTYPADLVLADLRLPDVDGLALFKNIRAVGVQVPFVLMSGVASATTAFDAGRLGVAEYVEKPVSAAGLLHTVRTHVRMADPLPKRVVSGLHASSAHTRRALRLIEDRYGDPGFAIHAAAAACGVTREHLARVIRDDTGRTFTDLLRARRMHQGRRLLTETTLRIKEICQRVGLTNTSDFDHAFKHIWQVSPKMYRRTWCAHASTITSAQEMSPESKQLCLWCDWGSSQ